MRIAFVKSHIPIDWQSCLYIFQNLDAAYSLLAPDRLHITSSTCVQENQTSAAKIHEFGADTIVFSDYHAKNFKDLVEQLAKEYANEKQKPCLSFHIYGNFSIEPNTWRFLQKFLQQFPCRFLCASERQSNFVRSFMHPFAEQSVETCAFPVNTKEFYFDPNIRKQTRKLMKWGDDFVILYAGRITPQKNVIPMLEEICENFLSKGRKARVVLAGGFDTMAAPLFKGGEKHGLFYQREYLDFLETLPAFQQKRIQYLGHKSHDELFKIYNGADIFACWSTYHDEDFGMAPAEALATGLPSLLTSWGGFADFAREHCRLSPVEITNLGIEIKTAPFRKDLKLYFKNRLTLTKQRNKFAKNFSKAFSPIAIKARLQQIYRKPAIPFLGFSEKIIVHSKLINQDLNGSIYTHASCKDPYYFLNYSHYTGQKYGK